MAGEGKRRIIEMPETTSIGSDDYFVIDSESGGTKKLPQSALPSKAELKGSIWGNEINILPILGSFQNKTHNGITYTPTSSGFKATGTSTAASYNAIYYDTTSLMQGFMVGDHFMCDVQTSDVNLRAEVIFFAAGGTIITPIFYMTNTRTVQIPQTAVGMGVRVNVPSGKTLNNATISFKIFKNKDNLLYGEGYYTKTPKTQNGITFEWDDDTERYYIHGTATGYCFYNIFHDEYALPAGIKPNKKVLLTFNTSNIHVAMAIIFYDSAKATIKTMNFLHGGVFVVPSNAVGMTLRFVVYAPFTVDDYIYKPIMADYNNRIEFAPISIGKPKFITFIDDDTSTDTYVDRYYNACMHNGIKGTYAVCTKQYRDGTNNLEKLKQYEAEGFNLCLHCDSQERYLNPTDPTYSFSEAKKNYIRAINSFRDLGLVNVRNAWVIPYGNRADVNDEMAKELNFDVALTTYGDVYNTVYDNLIYQMRRTGLSSVNDVTDDTNVSELGTMARCKARVDELANDADGGWLIITTHFNEWDDMTWDATLDENGYQVGYSRFNEFVAYAKSNGLEVVSMAKGISYFKPIIEANYIGG